MNTLDKLEWSDTFNTGIHEIDLQHERIVELVNNMQQAVINYDKRIIEDVLNEMTNYALSHFAYEEELMEESGYRFLNAHKKVHELFTRKLSTYIDKFKNGDNISIELNNMLVKWLFNHISREDMGYVVAIKQYYKMGEFAIRGDEPTTTDSKERKGFWSTLMSWPLKMKYAFTSTKG